MARNKGIASFSANFEPQVAAPLDARGKVATRADLLLSVTWQGNDGLDYSYIGMQTVVTSDSTTAYNGLYILNAADYTQLANWTFVGSDSSGLIGTLSSLLTTAKNNVVAAINELFTKADNALPASGGTLTNYTETTPAANSSTAITIGLANGNVQDITLTGNCTITLPSPPIAGSWSLTLRIIGGASAYAVTWAAPAGKTLSWLTIDNAAPALNVASGKINELVFDSVGTTKILGHFAGKEA